MVYNTTFNNISVISRRSVLLVEEIHLVDFCNNQEQHLLEQLLVEVSLQVDLASVSQCQCHHQEQLLEVLHTDLDPMLEWVEVLGNNNNFLEVFLNNNPQALVHYLVLVNNKVGQVLVVNNTLGQVLVVNSKLGQVLVVNNEVGQVLVVNNEVEQVLEDNNMVGQVLEVNNPILCLVR